MSNQSGTANHASSQPLTRAAFLALAPAALLAGSALLLSGCGTSSSSPEPDASNSGTDASADQSSQAEQESSPQSFVLGNDLGTVTAEGAYLFVTLASNPTTGYEWTFSTTGIGINIEEDEYTQDQAGSLNGEQAVGVGGTHTFRFFGSEAGEQSIAFTYSRSFDPDPDNDSSVIIDTTTDDKGVITIVDIKGDGTPEE